MALAKVRSVKGNTKSVTATSIKPLLPTGAASGDLLFVLIVCLTKVVGEYPKVTTPEGWTRVGVEGRSEESEAQRTVWLYYKEYDGSGEGFLPTFTADKESANSISAYCLAVEAGTFSKTTPVGAHDEWTLSAASTNPAIAATTATAEESLALAFVSWSTTPKEPSAGWVDLGGGTTTPGTDAIRKEAAVNSTTTGEPTLKKTGTKKGLSMMLAVNANLVLIKVNGGGAVKRTSEAVHASEPKVHGGGEVKRTAHVAGENRIAVTGGGQTKRTSEAVHLAEPKVSGGGEVRRVTERAPDSGMPKIVQRGKSSTANVSSLALAQAAASGTLLIAFVETLAGTGPTVTDDLGATWTAHPTTAVFQSGGASLTMYYKRAAGGEKEIKVSATSGIAYYEVEKLSEVVDVIAHVDAQKSTSSSFTGFSTTNARDLILGAWGLAGASGEVKPWTGTGPLTFISSASTRVVSGALVPEAPLTGVTFTANWTNNANNGGLVVAFLSAGVIKVAGGGQTKRTAYVQQGTSTHKASTQGSVTETGEVLLGTPLVAVHGGGLTTHRGSTATVLVHGGGLVRRTSSAIIGTVRRAAHGGGNTTTTAFYLPTITRRISGGGVTYSIKGNAIRVSGGGRAVHEKFYGPPSFPSNAPRAGRAEAVHNGRVETLTR